MIKEFWQERAEEKRKKKELKKQKRKQPKTKQERAYKIFGICLAFFLIFGSTFYTCRSMDGSLDGFSWDSLIGITDEIKIKLTQSVDKNDLIIDEQINLIHWDTCMHKLSDAGVDVVINDHLSEELLINITERPDSVLVLDYKSTGALIVEMLSLSTKGKDISLLEFIMYSSGDQVRIKTLMYVNLSAVALADNLPFVYISTDSSVEILDNSIVLLDTDFVVNNLSEEDNDEVIKVISKSSLLGLEYYTTTIIAEGINDFATYINSDVDIQGTKLVFTAKNI